MHKIENYTLIETQKALEQFIKENNAVEWMAIDTEFIGEKRYHTLLCLIQVATVNGLFLIDALKLKAFLRPFLALIETPTILKITHAGENDYRLFHELFDTIPKNIFDTQIAAAFVGYKFAVSFRSLVEEEQGIKLSKTQSVTDWTTRPIKRNQIKYALNDVIPLFGLWKNLSQKIADLNRQIWVEEEFKKLEEVDYYEKIPHRAALRFNLMPQVSRKEQAFIVRLFSWRKALAEERDHSEEMVLPKKNIAPIVRSIRSGQEGLKQNRRISSRFVNRYGEKMLELYKQPLTAAEEVIISQIERPRDVDPSNDLKLELLYSFIVYHCLEQKIATDLVMPRGIFKKMKADLDFVDESLLKGWRREVLGESIIESLRHRDKLTIHFGDQAMQLKIENV